MEVDVTTASRFHIGELIISGGIKCLMIFLWRPSLVGLLVFEAFLTAALEFHHSNVNIPLPIQDWMEKLVVMPPMHRCHHALHRNCFNTNLSTIFSLWDRLFRRYHLVRDLQHLVSIGLYKPRGPKTMHLKSFLTTPFQKD